MADISVISLLPYTDQPHSPPIWSSSSSLSSSPSCTSSLSIPKCCQICLNKYDASIFELASCRCKFCSNCLNLYIKQCIENCNVSPIYCPDAKCSAKGVLNITEIESLLLGDHREQNNEDSLDTSGNTSGASHSLIRSDETIEKKRTYEKYLQICETIEVLRDPCKTYCPILSCQNICTVEHLTGQKFKNVQVQCKRCDHRFCSFCHNVWMPEDGCEVIVSLHMKSPNPYDPNPKSSKKSEKSIPLQIEYCKCSLLSEVEMEHMHRAKEGLLSNLKDIKRCPNCSILIERAEGCAQIMCKMCRHTFCFYCLTSLDNDFLLKHFTQKGPCKGKLGHSRFSLFVHRLNVIGIFAGTVVVILIISPLILISLPCLLLSSKCRKTCFRFTSKFS